MKWKLAALTAGFVAIGLGVMVGTMLTAPHDADAQTGNSWIKGGGNPFAGVAKTYNGSVVWKKQDIITNLYATGAGDFAWMVPTTGYKFHKIGIEADAPDANQTFNIKFYATATDSTTIMTTGSTVNFLSGSRNTVWYDVPCAKVTFSNVKATDDFNVIGLMHVN